MSDNLQERGPRDRSRINVNQEHEVRYWSEALGVTEGQLRDAVGAVGPNAEKVRDFLRGQSAH